MKHIGDDSYVGKNKEYMHMLFTVVNSFYNPIKNNHRVQIQSMLPLVICFFLSTYVHKHVQHHPSV